MTRIVNGMLIIAPEPPQQCDMCGTIAELRPYGPNGEAVCFPCGMKDEDAMKRQFNKLLDQIEPR